MSAVTPEQPKTRPWVIVVGLLAVVAGIAWTVGRVREEPASIAMRDFVQYWSAAKVNLAGGNPYDAEQLKPYQIAALGELEKTGVTMMWNPPWILALVTPLGLLPASAAHFAFLGVQLAALVLSATMLWSVYGGAKSRLWVAWILALTFGPSAFLFWYGQIGGLLLLGLSGFLYFRQAGRPVPAGLCLALTAIKPHLLFAVGLVVLLDGLMSRRGRTTLLAAGGTLLLMAGGAWLMNPAVFSHYSGAGWQSSTSINTSPKDWAQPLFAYWLRMAVADGEQFWIQFVPMVVAAALVAAYWWRTRYRRDWPMDLPRLVFVSVITAPYGAWVFDLVVLLVPVIAVAAQLADRPGAKRYVAAAGFAVLTVGVVAAGLVKEWLTGTRQTGLHVYIWVSPAVLLLCAWAKAGVRPSPAHVNLGDTPPPRAADFRSPASTSEVRPGGG